MLVYLHLKFATYKGRQYKGVFSIDINMKKYKQVSNTRDSKGSFGDITGSTICSICRFPIKQDMESIFKKKKY